VRPAVNRRFPEAGSQLPPFLTPDTDDKALDSDPGYQYNEPTG